MSQFFLLFANNILPILIATAAGYLAARTLKINARPITQIAFYIFSPSLLFRLLTSNQLRGTDVFRVITVITASIFILGLLAWIVARSMQLERSLQAAMVLAVAFGNMGNFGLALVSFAFGDLALAYASIAFVIEAILLHTAGVMIATMGRLDFIKALLRLFRIPSIYAVVLALVINAYHWTIPLPIDRTISILSNAAIPVMMVVLGLQLYSSSGKQNIKAIASSSLLRLIGGAILGLLLSNIFGLKGAALQASVIQNAMPTAVLTTILAGEFDAQPSFVTSVVLTTTLLSPLVITPLLYLIGA